MLEGSTILSLCLMLGLVALNGVFVAAEFAIIKIRKTRVQELAEQGHPVAQTVRQLQKDMGIAIAGAQLGITVASLGLGWVGEDSMLQVVRCLFGLLPEGFPIPGAVAVGLSLVALSVLHVVFGEQVPKAMALRVPERVLLVLAYPFRLFCRLTFPLIWLMSWLSDTCLRLLGLPKAGDDEHEAHSPDELELLFDQSMKAGVLRPEEGQFLKRALELKQLTARQVMIPRTRMDSISDKLTLPQLLEVIAKTKHSRLPVSGGNRDQVIGILYTRDLFDLLRKTSPATSNSTLTLEFKDFSVSKLVRKAHFVPESISASHLLELMRANKIQMCVVVDEFGGTNGIVTLEDLIEQLVGEIWDEYDNPQPGVQKMEDERWHVSGDVTIFEFNRAFESELGCATCTTVAGMVMEKLDRLPEVQESVEIDGYRFTLLEKRGQVLWKFEVAKVPVDNAPVPKDEPPAAPAS